MADDSELAKATEKALSSLPAALRQALILRAVEGRSFAEMTVLLDAPESELRARYQDAKARLRELLGSLGRPEAEAANDPDPGAAAVELAAESLATESQETVLTPESIRLSPGLVICDPRMLQYLDQNPEVLRTINPRDFEQLVASMLDRFGYEVKLGPLGADGGVDVHATKKSETGLEYLLVQCKRFAADRKVSAPVVKQLWADVIDRGASRGLVVTTSWFTSKALEYVSQHKHQLSAADFDRVRGWLRQLSQRAA